jgi:hypothetical protein
MTELEAVLMHHDTITGTSTQRVIQSAIDKVQSFEIRNSLSLVDWVAASISKMTGLIIEGLNQCLRKVNDHEECPLVEGPLSEVLGD